MSVSLSSINDQQIFDLLALLHDGPPYVLTVINLTDRTRSFNISVPTSNALVAEAKNRLRAGCNTFVKLAHFDGAMTTKGQPLCKAANVIASRSLLIDVDGVGTTYATMTDAWNALEASRQAAGLPPWTYVQCSGHGLHALYILDEELTPSVWKTALRGLHNILEHLQHDRQAGTIDKGLRITGDDHPNLKEPTAPAKTGPLQLAATRTSWSALAAILQPRMLQLAAVGGVALGDFSVHAQFDLALVERECAAVDEAMENGGAGYSRGHWVNLTALAAASIDGWEWAQDMAYGHADYDEDETRRLFDSFSPGNRPVLTCATMATTDDGAAACGRCKWQGQVKSPQGILPQLALQAATQQQPTGAPPVPLPFALPLGYRNSKGMLLRQQEDGEWVKAAGFAVRDLEVFETQGVEPKRYIRLDTERLHAGAIMQQKTIEFDQAKALADPRALATIFSQAGAPVGRSDGSVHDAVTQLFKYVPPSAYRKGYDMAKPGWYGDVLVTDGVYTTAGRSVAAALFNGHETPQFLDVAGSQATYADLCTAILSNDQRPEAHLLTLAPLASPLVEPLGIEPGVMVFNGGTGTGKTSYSRLALSTLGGPEPIMAVHTANYLWHDISTRRIFAAIIDEYDKAVHKKTDRENLGLQLFSLASGVGRGRLTRDSGARPAPAYRGLAAFTANCTAAALGDRLATGYDDGAAVQARLIDIPFQKYARGVRLQSAFDALRNHHGWRWCRGRTILHGILRTCARCTRTSDNITWIIISRRSTATMRTCASLLR